MAQELGDDRDDDALQNTRKKNAYWYPRLPIRELITGTNNAVPPPKPAAMIPAARPLRFANHFTAEPTQLLYTKSQHRSRPVHRKRRAEQRRGVTHRGPSDTAKNSCRCDEQPRSHFIDQPSIQRLNPSLKEDEQLKSMLHFRKFPAVRVTNPRNKQCPGVLKIGDHDHGDHRRNKCPNHGLPIKFASCCFLFPQDFCFKAAAMKADRHRFFHRYLRCFSDHMAVGGLAYCVSTLENSQWTQSIQRVRYARESLMRFFQDLVDGVRQPPGADFDAMLSRLDECSGAAELSLIETSAHRPAEYVRRIRFSATTNP